MASILDRPISQWAGMEYSCACGKSHKVDIQAIRVGSGVIQELPGILRDLGASHIFLVTDNYTYEAAGRQVEQLLDQAGLSYHKRVFQTETPLVPNEYALGSVLAAMTSQDDMLLAVGSGTLNDVTKYVSARTGIPYVIAATAPSMDGYASTVAPTILDGFKTTLPAVYPAAIVADVDILKDAPMPMLTAGFGDIIGKFTSLADWRLSHQLNGEYYCPEVAGVIEAAVEKLDVKRSLFSKLSGIISPDCILATNTSSLSITAVASAVSRPDKVVGLHFFNPVPRMALIEIIRGAATSDETYEAAKALSERLGKTAVTVNEYPGFVVNRILIPMINEAVFMLQEGVASAEDIDTAMKLGANHPMGPLALADLIGLDVCLAIMELLRDEMGEGKYRPAPLLRKLVRAGRLGRKSGEGFFRY